MTVPGLSNVKSVHAGSRVAFALHHDGTVSAWGSNSYGQLGSGVGRSGTNPCCDPNGVYAVPVVDAAAPFAALADVTKVSADGERACALTTDKLVKCWGWNDYYAVRPGVGTQDQPQAWLVPGVSDVVDVAVGRHSVMALLSDGRIQGWGHNNDGALALTTAATTSAMPAFVDGFDTVDAANKPTKLYAAKDQKAFCVILEDKTAKCWGTNADGQLGTSSTDAVLTQPTTMAIATNLNQLSMGATFTCALSFDNTLKCFGSSANAVLGEFAPPPPPVVCPTGNVTEIIAFYCSTCVSSAYKMDFTPQAGDGSPIGLAIVYGGNHGGGDYQVNIKGSYRARVKTVAYFSAYKDLEFYASDMSPSGPESAPWTGAPCAELVRPGGSFSKSSAGVTDLATEVFGRGPDCIYGKSTSTSQTTVTACP